MRSSVIGCLALLLGSPALCQVYPYFPPPGLGYNLPSGSTTGESGVLRLGKLEWFNTTSPNRANSRLWQIDGTSVAGQWCVSALLDSGSNGQTDCNIKMTRLTAGGSVADVNEIDLNTYTAGAAQSMGMQLKNSMDLNFTGTLSTSAVDVTYTNTTTTCAGTGINGCGVRFRVADNTGLESFIGNSSASASTSYLTGGIASSGSQMGIATLNTSTSIDIGTNSTALLSMSGDMNTVRIQAGGTPVLGFKAVNNGSGVVTDTLAAHRAYSGSAPVVSACGTTPSIDAHATDASGTVTVGSVAATSCTITFAVAYTTWSHCRVTSQNNTAAFAYSYTLSAITVTATSFPGDLIDYACDGS